MRLDSLCYVIKHNSFIDSIKLILVYLHADS